MAAVMAAATHYGLAQGTAVVAVKNVFPFEFFTGKAEGHEKGRKEGREEKTIRRKYTKPLQICIKVNFSAFSLYRTEGTPLKKPGPFFTYIRFVRVPWLHQKPDSPVYSVLLDGEGP
jgi:hypothetical protein